MVIIKLSLKTCRFGEPRKKGEGIRVGTVRYLPRGIKKSELSRLDFFDIWFPVLAPGKELLKAFKERQQQSDNGQKTPSLRRWFFSRYRAELNRSADKRQSLQLLALMASRMPITIGCYCKDETLCHRSVLFEEIIKSASNLDLGFKTHED